MHSDPAPTGTDSITATDKYGKMQLSDRVAVLLLWPVWLLDGGFIAFYGEKNQQKRRHAIKQTQKVSQL